jgi:hypothetical protein
MIGPQQPGRGEGQPPEWVVRVSDQLVSDLETDFRRGPIADDEGRRFLIEYVVDRIGGLAVEIFAREEGEPHFRVRRAGVTARFTIRDCEPLDGDALWQFRRNIRAWWAEHKPELIQVWNEFRPADCPVGPYREEHLSLVGNFLCVVFEQDGGPRNTVGRREIAAVKEEKISGPHFGVTVSFRLRGLASLPTCWAPASFSAGRVV